jgi:CBS domain-containing protein
MKSIDPWECGPVEISDQDILKAMKTMEGYLDITPGDFREVYRVAYRFALDHLRNAQRARDVMTRPVWVVEAETDLAGTASLLAGKGISGAPVTDSTGRVIGVISEKDFLRHMGAGDTVSFMKVIADCLKSQGCIAMPMRNQKARDIMTSPAITASEHVSVSDLSRMLTEKGINRIPIVDGDQRPVGIFTRTNLLISYCRIG